MWRSPLPLLLTTLLACTPVPEPRELILPPDDEGEDPTDPVTPTVELPQASTSGRFVTRHDGNGMLLADPDLDAVSWYRPIASSGSPTTIAGEPTRLVRLGERYFVTLRASGEIAELSAAESEPPVEVRRAAVGSEPFDVVVSNDLTRLYVSLSMEDAVIALDVETLAEVGRWTVPFEPRWMAMGKTAEGADRLFVASARDPQVTEIVPSAEPGSQLTARPLPLLPRDLAPECGDFTLAMRITGDLELNDQGTALWVAALYSDPELEVPDLADVADTGVVPFGPCTDGRILTVDVPVNIWGVPTLVVEPARVSQFNPALVKLSLSADVQTEVISASTVSNWVAAPRVMRGYPTDIELLHDLQGQEMQVMATLETADTLVAIDLRSPTTEDSGPFRTYTRSGFLTAAGPAAVAYADDDPNALWVWSWLDRTVGIYDAVNVAEHARRGQPSVLQPAVRGTSPAPTGLSEAAQRGRRLFFSSNNNDVVAPNSGTSCANCHPDGRSDGLTWLADGLPRQAPSLHGIVSTTAPLGWEGKVETVQREVILTTSERTGGNGLSETQADDVAAFIDSTRDIVVPPIRTDEERAQVELGREVFSREAVGCAECHNGEQGTDNEIHEVFGYEINTPRLRGLAGSAPYFRDGSARSLREVVERSIDGSMGDTSTLSEEEITALVAYLRRF
jgi:cytochrome c553